jgi:hypothetical protein
MHIEDIEGFIAALKFITGKSIWFINLFSLKRGVLNWAPLFF